MVLQGMELEKKLDEIDIAEIACETTNNFEPMELGEAEEEGGTEAPAAFAPLQMDDGEGED